MLPILFFFVACGEPVLTYQCTCTQIAYGANGEYIDNSFTENICDTESNIKEAFKDGGFIDQGIQECESEFESISEDSNYDCSCECLYLSEC